MRVKCPKCKTIQRLNQSIEPGELRRIACGKCGVTFSVRKPAPKPEAVEPQNSPAPDTAPPPLPSELQLPTEPAPPIPDPLTLTPSEMENIGTHPAGAADVLPSSILDAPPLSPVPEDLPFPAELAPSDVSVPATPPAEPLPPVDAPESTDIATPPQVHSPPSNAPLWRVRKRDGTTMEFPNLQKFQQRVLDGVITIDDEISRNGHFWRHVHEIPELVGLCDRADELKQARTQPYPMNAPPPGFAPLPPAVSTDIDPPMELPDTLFDSTEIAPPLPEKDALTEPDGGVAEPISAISDGFESDLLTNLDIPLPEELDDPADLLGESAPIQKSDQDTIASSATEAGQPARVAGELTNVMLSAMNEGSIGGFVDIGDDPALFGAPDAAQDLASISPAMDPMMDGLGVHDLSDNPTMTEAEEMALAGSTLQMKLPDAQAFELGKAIEMDLAGNDPFAAVPPAAADLDVVPTDNVPPGISPTDAPGPINAPPAPAAAGIQPPITSDETGGLGMGWVAKVMVAIVVQALIGVAIYLYLESQQDEESVQTVSTASSTTPENAPQQTPAKSAAEPTASAGKEVKTILTKVDTTPSDVDGPVRAKETPARSERKAIESGLTGALAIAETPKQKRERLKKLAEAKANEAERARRLAEEAARQADGGSEAKPKPEKKPEANNADKKPRKPRTDTRDQAEPKPEPKPQRPPDSYDGLMSAARKALKAGASARALAYLREAAKLNPRSVEPIAKMGWAYLRMNNTSQAIIKFSEAKAKNPGYRNTYVGLGKAFERAGRKPEAIGVYRQYLRICANCRRAESVRAALLRLGATH